MASNNFVPQYQIIYNDLKEKIQNGDYAPDSQLPYERELCEAFGVQRITVRKALDLLVQDNLIHKRRGLGSFVQGNNASAGSPALTGSLLFVMNKSQNDIHNNSSAYNAQLFFLMEQICRQEGYTLLYTGISNANQIRVLTEQHHIIGAFLVSTLEEAIINQYLQIGFPLLCLNHYDPRILSVLPDNQNGIAEAVSHLVRLGHTNIAFIGGPSNAHNAKERLSGYISALNNSGIPLRPELILQGDWTYESGLEQVKKMLSAIPREACPSGLIAASDMMAIGAIEAINQMGLNVPKDISVIGFDNIDSCKLCSPQLTSIGPDTSQMANIAMDMMTMMLQRGCTPYNRYTVRVPVSFAERNSVSTIVMPS